MSRCGIFSLRFSIILDKDTFIVVNIGYLHTQKSKIFNSNYSSELYAFGHRLGVPEIPVDLLVQALTTESFASRRDVESDAVSPNHDESHSLEHNLDLSAKGIASISRILSCYLRAQLSEAPEELIQAISLQLTNDETLADIARHLGIDVLIRTAENPPSVSSIATSFQALCGALAEDKVQQLVFNFVVPQLLDVDFVDVFPLNDPLAVLTDLLKIDGVSEVEPRILRSAGVNSAHPVYVVGIFKDKLDIVGESAGETLEVAVDMAARNGLLRLWGLTSDRVFFFGDKISAITLNDFKKENYRLSDKCAKSTDLSVQQDASVDPINVVEVAMKYKEEVESVVGKSYTKRLRHKFSRGSLAKRSFRYLVKPKVYTIA